MVADKLALEFSCDVKVIDQSDYSMFDLLKILRNSLSKIVVFPSQETIHEVERLIPSSVNYHTISSNRASVYLQIMTGEIKNLLAVDYEIRGLNVNVDQWVFYDFTKANALKALRTSGQNILFLKT